MRKISESNREVIIHQSRQFHQFTHHPYSKDMGRASDNWNKYKFPTLLTLFITSYLTIGGIIVTNIINSKFLDFGTQQTETRADIKKLSESKVDKVDYNRDMLQVQKQLDNKVDYQIYISQIGRAIRNQEINNAIYKENVKKYNEYLDKYKPESNNNCTLFNIDSIYRLKHLINCN